MQEQRIDGTFGKPEVYDQEKMLKKLLDSKIESVNIFKGTNSNITLAEYRAKYPRLTRKQLKARIKNDKKLEPVNRVI